MKKIIIIIAILFTGLTSIKAQVGINATGSAPVSSAMLDISSTTKGLLIPRMTTTQRTTGIASPATGLLVYDTTLNQLYIFNGSNWTTVSNSTITAPLNLSSTGYPITGTSTTNGNGIQGVTSTGIGVYGVALLGGGSKGVFGLGNAVDAIGIHGVSEYGTAVYGSTINGIGVEGNSSGAGRAGFFSSAAGLAIKTASGNVEFDGFTKLGNDVATPRIKMKKLTGILNTNITTPNLTQIAYGLNVQKIISVSVLVEYDIVNHRFVPPRFTQGFTGAEYTYQIVESSIDVVNVIGNSSLITGKPYVILITYEQ